MAPRMSPRDRGLSLLDRRPRPTLPRVGLSDPRHFHWLPRLRPMVFWPRPFFPRSVPADGVVRPLFLRACHLCRRDVSREGAAGAREGATGHPTGGASLSLGAAAGSEGTSREPEGASGDPEGGCVDRVGSSAEPVGPGERAEGGERDPEGRRSRPLGEGERGSVGTAGSPCEIV